MLAEEDGLGWVGAGRGWYGLECIWSVLFVVYLRKGTDCMEMLPGYVQTVFRVKVGKVGNYLIDKGNSRRKVPPFLSLS